MFSTKIRDLRMSREEHGNWGIPGSQRGQAEPEHRGAGDSPERQPSARAHRKWRAWLAWEEEKFQSLEAGPWGCHSVFSLGFIKQIITKQPKQPLEHNNNKNHPKSGSLQK